MFGVSFGGNNNSTNSINVKNESEGEKITIFFNATRIFRLMDWYKIFQQPVLNHLPTKT
jgi:hypothetical protein